METRDGLIRYEPSHGEEHRLFRLRCMACRHYDHNAYQQCDPNVRVCSWGILDRLLDGKFDPERLWFQPEDIAVMDNDGDPICPATCLRFTGRDDPDGELRDPPAPDCDGQMMFGEIDTPVERVPVKVEVRA